MLYEGLNLSKLTDEEAMFFIRIRGKKSYFNAVYTKPFLDIFSSIKEFRCISEYKKDAYVHIDINSVCRDYLYEEEYARLTNVVSLEELIIRCRALRNSSYVEAKKLISRTFLFFDNFFKEQKSLKLIVTGAIDNYVMDLMHRVGSTHGIKFIGITDSFMSPQYKLVTLRGEANTFADVSSAEVLEVYNVIAGRSLSPIVPSCSRALKAAVYDLGSYLYRYFVRYIFLHKLFGRLEYEYQFAPMLSKFNSLDKLFALRYLKRVNDETFKAGLKYAYVPLHYYPEATVDYWVKDAYHVDYYNSLLDTIKKLKDEGFVVVVKEHPSYFLARPSKIYQSIEKMGCILLSPFMSTKELMTKVDLVVVWNGSTGIEAIVNKKPVVRVTNSYYGDNVVPVLSGARKLTELTYQQGLDVVEKVLATSFRTR